MSKPAISSNQLLRAAVGAGISPLLCSPKRSEGEGETGKIFLRTCILFILIFFIPIFCSAQEDKNERLRYLVNEYGQAEVSVRTTDRHSIDFLTRNFSVSSVKDGIVRLRISPLTLELFISQKYTWNIEELYVAKGLSTVPELKGVMQWDTYPSYSQYLQIILGFAKQYPGLCRVDTIGTTNYGKLVLALKISDNAESDEDEPEVFYTSTMHGDETGGFILMLRLIDYFLKNYDSNSRIRNLADNLEIWINPLANPDGMYGTGEIMVNPKRFNSNDYDLNRNFPDPFTPYNSSNVIQKETADMCKFLREHRFVLSANFHSGDEVVNYPWDRWLTKLHADNRWFRDISRGYADTVHRYSSPVYMNGFENGIVRGATWYLVYGGRQDFVTWELQGREVTIELDKIYITPAGQLGLLWENNYRSLIGYLENALYGIHGKVTSATNSYPVASKIFIAGYDKDSSHVYSDTLSGSFVRMLTPGSYNLTFSAFGYRDTIISGVNINRFETTSLDVVMTPLSEPRYKFPVLYPNPAINVLKAVIPNDFAGIVNIKIYNTTGMLLKDYNAEAVINTPLNIDISGFAQGTYIIVFTAIQPKFSGNQKIPSVRGRFIVIR
jgi:hypothetical protein